LVELIDVRDSRKTSRRRAEMSVKLCAEFQPAGTCEGAHVIADKLSDLPSPAEAGFAKTGNRVPSFAIML
jgi:hypothetical protein